jgi:surface antigen
MREASFLLSFAAAAATGFVVVAALFLSPQFAQAGAAAKPGQHTGRATCSCPENNEKSSRPKFAELKPSPDGQPLDASDEIAALTSVQHALSQTGDGSNYVWHRHNGRLSGIVKPTSSFKNGAGEICRHIVVMLTTGNKTRKTEGVACRQLNGVWSLEG